VEEKRRQILDAAVRVFAHKGFHTSRVGDIAEEAGVAHGLLYHYFDSKDQLLETVFHENWSVLLERIRAVEETDEPAAEQLRHVALIILRTWKHEPDVVRVVVREIARSPEVQQRIGELVEPVDSIRRIIERGQAAGEFRTDLDPGFTAAVFYGGIDALLTAGRARKPTGARPRRSRRCARARCRQRAPRSPRNRRRRAARRPR